MDFIYNFSRSFHQSMRYSFLFAGFLNHQFHLFYDTLPLLTKALQIRGCHKCFPLQLANSSFKFVNLWQNILRILIHFSRAKSERVIFISATRLTINCNCSQLHSNWLYNIYIPHYVWETYDPTELFNNSTEKSDVQKLYKRVQRWLFVIVDFRQNRINFIIQKPASAS